VTESVTRSFVIHSYTKRMLTLSEIIAGYAVPTAMLVLVAGVVVKACVTLWGVHQTEKTQGYRRVKWRK
jgi:hypothetical protein